VTERLIFGMDWPQKAKKRFHAKAQRKTQRRKEH
jgi:hypothetical protein